MNTQEKTPYQNEVDALLQETEAKMKDLHAKYPLEKEKVTDATKKVSEMLAPIFKNVSNSISELNFSLKFHQSNTPDFGALLKGLMK